MKRPEPKVIAVKEVFRLTPNMQRVIFSGEGLNNFPDGVNGAHLKLLLPNPETGKLEIGGKVKPKVRTYTVRNFDYEKKELCVDFALHKPAGPATSWALQAKAEDKIAYMGPGPIKVNPNAGDWFLFAADMSALPAAISVIEQLNDDAKGFALLEITSKEDKQNIKHPKGLKIEWLIHPNPKERSEQQKNAIGSLDFPEGKPNVFVAGELGTVRDLKDYLLEERLLDAEFFYASSYWKIGLNEELHQEAKRKA